MMQQDVEYIAEWLNLNLKLCWLEIAISTYYLAALDISFSSCQLLFTFNWAWVLSLQCIS